MLRPFVSLCGGATAVHQQKCQVHHRQLREFYFASRLIGLLCERIMQMKERGRGSVKSSASLYLLFHLLDEMKHFHSNDNTMYIQYVSAISSAHCR